MWECLTQSLQDGRVRLYQPRRDGAAVSYRQVLRLMRDDEPFRAWWIATLARAPFAAYKWETPAITAATADREFEFVLLDAPGLTGPADRNAFRAHFDTAGEATVVTFANLGRDATLVVPCPLGNAEAYVHLGAFVRSAPATQVNALWQAVAAAMEAAIGTQPVWLSTAGMGVAWLHVRLDSRPKYYGYAAYREG